MVAAVVPDGAGRAPGKLTGADEIESAARVGHAGGGLGAAVVYLTTHPEDRDFVVAVANRLADMQSTRDRNLATNVANGVAEILAKIF